MMKYKAKTFNKSPSQKKLQGFSLGAIARASIYLKFHYQNSFKI